MRAFSPRLLSFAALVSLAFGLTACPGEDGPKAVLDPALVARRVRLCATVRGCDRYGSVYGNLRVWMTGEGDAYNINPEFDERISDARQDYDAAASRVYAPAEDRPACKSFDLRATAYRGDAYFWPEGLSFEHASYFPTLHDRPILTDGSDAYSYESDDLEPGDSVKLYRSVATDALVAVEEYTGELGSYSAQRGEVLWTGRLLHALELSPVEWDVDFSAGEGSIVFDCALPSGGRD